MQFDPNQLAENTKHLTNIFGSCKVSVCTQQYGDTNLYIEFKLPLEYSICLSSRGFQAFRGDELITPKGEFFPIAGHVIEPIVEEMDQTLRTLVNVPVLSN